MNIKEDVAEIKKDVSCIKSDIEYIKKMMEDFVLTLSPQDDKKQALKSVMSKISGIIAKDPNMQKHPDIKNTINDLFKVII